MVVQSAYRHVSPDVERFVGLLLNTISRDWVDSILNRKMVSI